jgi:hypothetical protein
VRFVGWAKAHRPERCRWHGPACAFGRAVRAFSPKPKVIEGLDAAIKIASLGIDLPLAEIYAGAEYR